MSNFYTNQFPFNHYLNDIRGWGIPEAELHSKLDDGTYALLTLDIDFGHKCSLNCPHCFKKHPAIRNIGQALTFNEIKLILVEAKKLGLKSIKILGAGEPFENSDFIDFLEFSTDLDITVAVFTKGHVIGSDNLAKKYFGHKGINSAEDLVKAIFKLDVSILLGFNSFLQEKQLDYVGMKQNSKIGNYFNLRNNALELLINNGFNKYKEGEPTRLGIVASPFRVEDLDEIFEIIKWGREKNIYVVTCPTTNSGNGRSLTNEIITQGHDKYLQQVIEFYTHVYIWSIEVGIITLDRFKFEGVSLYPGAHVCNQTAAGMYITHDGLVLRCPGLDDKSHVIYSDIRKGNLKEIWMQSENYKLATKESQYNFYCIARDNHLFTMNNFYNIIQTNVLLYFNGK